MKRYLIIIILVMYSICFAQNDKQKELPSMKGFVVNQYRIELPENYDSFRGVERVVLQVDVTAESKIDTIFYVSGPIDLKDLALENAKTWQYVPDIENGIPTNTSLSIEVFFYVKEIDVFADTTGLNTDRILKVLLEKHEEMENRERYYPKSLLYYEENQHIYSVDDYYDFHTNFGFTTFPNKTKAIFQTQSESIFQVYHNDLIGDFNHEFYHLPIAYTKAKGGVGPFEMNHINLIYQKGKFLNNDNLDFALQFFGQDGEWISTFDKSSSFSTHLEYRTLIGRFQLHSNFLSNEFSAANITSIFQDYDVQGDVNSANEYPNGTAYQKMFEISLLYQSQIGYFGGKYKNERIENSYDFEKKLLSKESYLQMYYTKKFKISDFSLAPKIEYVSKYYDKDNLLSPSVELITNFKDFEISSFSRFGFPYTYYQKLNILKKATTLTFGFKSEFYENDSDLLFSTNKNDREFGLYFEKNYNDKVVNFTGGISNKYNDKDTFYCNNEFVLPFEIYNLKASFENNVTYRNLDLRIYPKAIDRLKFEIIYPLKFDNAIFGSTELIAHSSFNDGETLYEENHLLQGNIGIQISRWFKVWMEFKNITNRKLMFDKTTSLVPYGYSFYENNQHSNIRFEWTFIN